MISVLPVESRGPHREQSATSGRAQGDREKKGGIELAENCLQKSQNHI